MSSIRERILSAQDIRSERVAVEAWGVEVEVRGLSAGQRAKVMNAPGVMREDGTVNNPALFVPLLIASCYDPETKKPVFTEADLDALAEKNGAAVESIAVVALRLSGLSDQAAEQIEKN